MSSNAATSQLTVVVGAGVAGSAIALELCRRGLKVALIYGGEEEGSSFTNQKWLHSGLLYPDETIARKACLQFHSNTPLKSFVRSRMSEARFLALNEQTLMQRRRMWDAWGVREWGLDWRSLQQEEYQSGEGVGATLAIGGFGVPDRIVDFPGVVAHMRREVRRLGGAIISGARVKRIRVERHRVDAVELVRGSEHRRIECTTCVLAAGAWSTGILLSSGIAAPDLILRKCVVFAYDGELVGGLTTCLDARRHDGTLQDVTLVPFRGTTLAAGTGFTEVVDPDDDQPDPVEIERLTDQLTQCFPKLRAHSPRIFTCTKTEKRPGGKANVNPQIFGPSAHGVTGLTVAIPGKASFMFDLATDAVSALSVGGAPDARPSSG